MTQSLRSPAIARIAAGLIAAGSLTAETAAQAQDRAGILLMTTSVAPGVSAAPAVKPDDPRGPHPTQSASALDRAAFATPAEGADTTAQRLAQERAALHPPEIQPKSEWFSQEGWQMGSGGLTHKSRF